MKTKLYLATMLISALEIGSLQTYADSWVQKADIGGSTREGAAGFSIGTKGYIGTANDTGYTNDFWEYDQSNNMWTQKASIGVTARIVFAVGFAIGTKGYIGSGFGSTNAHSDLWEYDTTGNTWTLKAPFGSIGRYYATGFAIGTKGYIGTGGSYDTMFHAMNDFWEYDPLGNTWSQKANFAGTARSNAAGFAIGTKGYIGTGQDTISGDRNDFWEYDQGANTWTQKADFSGLARGFATGFAIGTRGYIGTGADKYANPLNDIWEYNQSSNIWVQKANFGGVARYLATSFAIGTKGYIGGGNDGNAINDFWEYTPDSVNGIEELNITNSINIYPNPLTSSSILQLDAQVTNAEVIIYDMVGKVMMTQLFSGNRVEIKRNGMESGVYFVAIKTKDQQWVKKMVVE